MDTDQTSTVFLEEVLPSTPLPSVVLAVDLHGSVEKCCPRLYLFWGQPERKTYFPKPWHWGQRRGEGRQSLKEGMLASQGLMVPHACPHWAFLSLARDRELIPVHNQYWRRSGLCGTQWIFDVPLQVYSWARRLPTIEKIFIPDPSPWCPWDSLKETSLVVSLLIILQDFSV